MYFRAREHKPQEVINRCSSRYTALNIDEYRTATILDMIQKPLHQLLDNTQITTGNLEGQHELALPILLAIIVHIALITALKFQPNTQIKSPNMFDVRLMPLHTQENLMEVEPNNTKSDEQLTSASVKTTQKSQAPITKKTENINLADPMPSHAANKIDAQPNTEPPLATINIAPNADTHKPKISTEALLESAHRVAIEDAQTMPKEKDDGIALADRPISPKLALVLAKKKRSKTGITNYADGTVKVVNPDGSSYCLQPPPFTSMPSGPFESISIPMTCPED